MEERGIDAGGHRARQVTPEILSSSELILVMEQGHRAKLESWMPAARGRVHLLGRWLDDAEVADPYRKDETAFRDSLTLIDSGLDAWIQRLWA